MMGERASVTASRARSTRGVSALPRITRAKAAPNSRMKVPRCSHALAEASRKADPPRRFTVVLPTGAPSAVRAAHAKRLLHKAQKTNGFSENLGKVAGCSIGLALVGAD